MGMRTAVISLSDVRFHAFIGVFPQEQAVGNEYSVDVSVQIPLSDTVSDADNLGLTISYADIFEEVKEEMIKKTQLLETVAARIADRICNRWESVDCGSVKITKLAPPIGNFDGKASVEIKF